MSESIERWRADVESMIAAAERAIGYVEGLSQTDFVDDPKTQDAVVMNLIVLAEASKGPPARVKAKAGDVPWNEMLAFRHRAAHSGSTVDLTLDISVVWSIVRTDLPALLPRLRSLLP